MGAIAGTGGLGGLLAWLFVPPKTRFDAVEKRIAALENEVSNLRTSNRFLTMGVTALTMHSDSMRVEIMRNDPDARIETAADVLGRVSANIKAMDEAGVDGVA